MLVYNAGRSSQESVDLRIMLAGFNSSATLDSEVRIKAVRLTECSAGASGAAPEEKQSGRAEIVRPPVD